VEKLFTAATVLESIQYVMSVGGPAKQTMRVRYNNLSQTNGGKKVIMKKKQVSDEFIVPSGAHPVKVPFSAAVQSGSQQQLGSHWLNVRSQIHVPISEYSI
jgi:hypothetical protein